MTVPLGVVDDLDEADYLALRRLSYSSAKTLLDCPARFAYELEHGRPPKREYDIGHGAHKYLLGKGAEIVVCDVPYRAKHPRAGEIVDDWQTVDAQTWRDGQRAAGRVPLLDREHRDVLRMVTAVRASPAGPLFAEGRPEVSILWDDEETGVPLRCRIDWLRHNSIVDLKTCESASPAAIRRAAYDYGYWLQHATNTEGAAVCGLGDLPMVFVFVETKRPHIVTVVRPEDDAIEYGRRRWREAIDLYDACLQAGQWPGYAADVIGINLPAYAR